MKRPSLSWLALGLSLALSSCNEPPPGPGPGPDPDPDPEAVEIPELPPQISTVHGMLIVGEESVFLSHLPLFSAPHDFQLLLSLEFDNAADKATYVADRQANPDEDIYTIEPSAFRLNNLADALRNEEPFPITVDVIRGHFERPPFTRILSNVPASITKTYHFRQLDADEAHPAESHYFIFGEAGENFLAHVIRGRPDFDHVLSVTAPDGLVNDDVARELSIPALDDAFSLSEGQTIDAVFNGQTFSLTVGREFYFEENELSF
jgi:hypothetical protein